MVKSGISQEEIISWGGETTFNQGLKIVRDGLVGEVAYDDDTLEVSGKIEQPSGWMMPVKFKLLAGGSIRSLCPCDINRKSARICPHVTAIAIALMVQEMDDESGKVESNPTFAADGATGASRSSEPSSIEVPAAVKFDVVATGSRASMSVIVYANYDGGIRFPALSEQPPRRVWFEDPDDDLVRRVRNLKAEENAVRLLKQLGFGDAYVKGDPRLYTTDSHKVLNFLGGGIPFLRRQGISCELSGKIGEIYDAMSFLVPVVSVKDVEGEEGKFDVSCRFDTSGMALSDVDVQQAMNRGDNFILKDGRVTLFDGSAIEEMRGVFRETVTRQGGAPRGWFRVDSIHSAYVKSALDSICDTVDIDDAAAPRWRRRAATLNREENREFAPPDLGRLNTVLRDYQKAGVGWMFHLSENNLGGLLADEMGLGKTLQTLSWLSLIHRSANPSTSLIICPTSLVRNWESEAKKWTPWLRTLVISGPDRAADFGRIAKADIVITSYALLQRDLEDAYLGLDFNAVVLDEAQHIKNRQTRNARAAKQISALHRLVLTGTPIENSVADVWSIFDFLMPGYLGDWESFKLNYMSAECDDSTAPRGTTLSRSSLVPSLEKLRRKLHPFILRRLKQDVAKDLPDKLVSVVTCTMPDDAMRKYLEVLHKERKGAQTRFQMLALLMKLRRIASGGKVEALMEQLEEALDGGHRVLVFSQFVTQLKTIAEELRKAGISFCYLDGSTKDRLGECEKFNRDRTIQVFLISLMAGGTGLNLTGADMVIHYDPWWNPAVEDQATDRAHRIGQKKKVHVVKLIAHDSVEERVLALQRKKKAIIAATVESTDESIANSLSLEDLASLLR